MPVDATSASKLKQACDAAYALHPNSCSHAVWHVSKQYLPSQPWMNANSLIEHLRGQAHWKVVPSGQVGQLARDGVLVVGGKTESGNGHVIVVYPGADMPAGATATPRTARWKHCAHAAATRAPCPHPWAAGPGP